MKLSTKTLEKLDTTLELVLVNDFLIDFKAAIGNVFVSLMLLIGVHCLMVPRDGLLTPTGVLLRVFLRRLIRGRRM